MRSNLRNASLAVVAILAASGFALAADAPTFDRIVSLGDSLTAGYQSGSLFEAAQSASIGSIFAAQVGSAVYVQPLVTDPGIPGRLELLHLSPLTIQAKSGMGTPKNLTYPAPYNNLGIPGAKAQDVLATKTVCGYNPFSPTCTNPYYDLVLRNQPTLPTYTAVEQAIAQNPTFVVLWAGNNDVLGAATNGAAVDRVTLTPAADVDLSLRTIIGALKAHTQAKILLVNLPDAGAIPFVTTIPSILLDPITSDPVLDSGGHPISLVGQKQGELPGTIPAGTRVTLGASSLMKGKCLGIPVGKSATWDAYCSTLTLNLQGYPLPDGGMVNGNFQPGVLLYSDEINAITSRTQEINTRIAAIGTEMGIPVLDINGIFRDAAEDGLVFGGVDFNAEFLTGGLFSFDGVHLTNLGYAIVANEMVKAVDIYWNLDIPQVDLYPYMFGSTSAAWLVGSNAPFLYSEEAVEQIRKLFPPTLPAVVLDLDRKDLPLRETGNIK